MREHIQERTVEAAKYILSTGGTVRETARELNVSKSTIHKDLTERLPKINPMVASAVREVLLTNKIRASTKLRYRRFE